MTGRLNSPVKRDTYAEVLNAHYEVMKRGEFPGTGHLQKRQSARGFLHSSSPTISPAIALDEDGHDVSKYLFFDDVDPSLLRSHRTWK